MQGDPDIVELLNEVLTAELTAVNQYFLDAKMLHSWGLERLAHQFREESIDEMKDAEVLIDRILYLDGIPNLQRLGTVRIGETPREKLEVALDLEQEAISRLNRGIIQARDAGDSGSRELLERILVGEERHAEWVETQLDAMERLGEAAYLAQQLHR